MQARKDIALISDIARDLQVFCWPPPAAAANSDRLPHRLRPAPRARSQRQHIITICHAMRAGDLWVDFDKLLRLSILCGCCIGIECLGTRRSQESAHVQAADQSVQSPRVAGAVFLLTPQSCRQDRGAVGGAVGAGMRFDSLAFSFCSGPSAWMCIYCL